MEAIWKAQQALKDVEKELKGLDSEASRKEGDIANKTAKIESLNKEIADLEAKKVVIQESVNSMELNAKKGLEVKATELRVLEGQLYAEFTKAKQEQVLAQQAQKDAADAKKGADAQYEEYGEKLKDLTEKREKLASIKF